MSSPPPWHQLVARMALGDDVTLRGTMRVRDVHPVEPGTPGARQGADGSWWLPEEQVLHASRRGDLVRIERDGHPLLIVGEEQVWLFEDAGEPTAYQRGRIAFGFPGDALLRRRPLEAWQGEDFARPVAEPEVVEVLGRAAWRFALHPPTGKPHPLEQVVDAATGMVLREANEGFGTVAEWVELEVGADLDDTVFTWTGGTRPPAAHHEREQLERTAWVHHHGWSAVGLRLPVRIDPHVWDDDAGSFEASLTVDLRAALARRPRSDEVWEHRWPWQTTWSDATHDWLLGAAEEIPESTLRALRAQLG